MGNTAPCQCSCCKQISLDQQCLQSSADCSTLLLHSQEHKGSPLQRAGCRLTRGAVGWQSPMNLAAPGCHLAPVTQKPAQPQQTQMGRGTWGAWQASVAGRMDSAGCSCTWGLLENPISGCRNTGRASTGVMKWKLHNQTQTSLGARSLWQWDCSPCIELLASRVT